MDRGVSREIGGKGGRELVGFPNLLIPVYLEWIGYEGMMGDRCIGVQGVIRGTTCFDVAFS